MFCLLRRVFEDVKGRKAACIFVYFVEAQTKITSKWGFGIGLKVIVYGFKP